MPLIIVGMKENLHLFITQYSSDDGDPGPGSTDRLGPLMGIMPLGPLIVRTSHPSDGDHGPGTTDRLSPVAIHRGANLDISVC